MKHPPRNRKKLTVGRDNLEVKLSKEDRDLAGQHWYQHSAGYVYRRPYEEGGRRPVVWLHKVIAMRMLKLKNPPRWVRFKNKCRLDCRRENLVIVRTE